MRRRAVPVEAVPGKTDPSIIALWLLNGVLTRWQHDGRLADQLTPARRQSIIDEGLRNACSGALLAPLLMPGEALDTPAP